MILGVALFISLYVMVVITEANFIKYVVTITGYIACLVFMFGIIIFKSTISFKKQEEKKEEQVNENM